MDSRGSDSGVLSPGFQIDRYQILNLLGQGGFGEVYEARHQHSGRVVALKVLSQKLSHSQEMVERFFREARAAAQVGNPHIVDVLDCGFGRHGRPFLAMALLQGEDLSTRLHRENTLPPEQAVDVTLQLLEGLNAAHASGVVHRDLKPANVFISKKNGRDFATIVDFGVSKVQQSSLETALTRTGQFLGTPRYMAPEQIQSARDADHRVDLFATAALLFRMLSGQHPYSGSSTAEYLYKVLEGRVRPLEAVAPDAPEALCLVVNRGLAADPDGRWQQAEEFARALSEATDTNREGWSQPSPPTEPGYDVPTQAVQGQEQLGALVTQPSLAGAAAPQEPSPAGAATPQEPSPAGAAAPQPASHATQKGVSITAAVVILGALSVLLAMVIGIVALVLFWPRDQEQDSRSSVHGSVGSPNVEIGPNVGMGPNVHVHGVPQPSAPPFAGPPPSALPPPPPLPLFQPQPLIFSVQAIGGIDDGPAQAVLEGARPALLSCVPAGQAVTVRIQAFVALPNMPSRLSRVQPNSTDPGSLPVAQCAVAAFQAAVPPGWNPGPESGIYNITITIRPPAFVP